MNDVVGSVRNRSIAYLKARFSGQMAIVDEYVEEAEHQEGVEYWLDFESAEELEADFQLYLENRM